jgi:hypothetical protein
MVPHLLAGVPLVAGSQHRAIQEDLLTLGPEQLVALPDLRGIPVVPLEAGQALEELGEQGHRECIWNSYTTRKSGGAIGGVWLTARITRAA